MNFDEQTPMASAGKGDDVQERLFNAHFVDGQNIADHALLTTLAIDAGLHYVYTGNVHDSEGGTTFCPGCQAALIERDWYNIRRHDLPGDGRCPHCGTLIAGHFARFGKPFGARRVPVRLR